MLFDTETDAIPPELRADIAVVGAGPAGISLALALAGRGLEVLVLESGGPGIEQQADELLEVTVSGEDYPASDTRVRALGGTSNVWGGRAHPLDPQDLRVRDWVPDSGWPFDLEELAGWYPGAQELLEVGPEPFDVEHWAPRLGRAGVSVIETDRLSTALYRLSPPTNFGERYRDELVAAPDVAVWLRATVVNIVAAPDGSAVSALEVVSADGDRSVVEAAVFVLATGGLEVPRLLLASRDIEPAGIGNRRDLVGRYFMEHPHLDVATAVLSGSLGEPFGEGLLYGIGLPVEDSVPALAHLVLRPEVVADEEIVPVAVTLVDVQQMPPHVDAVRALVSDIDGSDAWVRTLALRGEQVPVRENRVTLGSEVDRFGVPRAHLHWEVGATDRLRYARAVEIIADELGRAGIGVVRSQLSDLDQFPTVAGGHHHMGTARMHEDPTRGVVDADGRVHGMSNLYVAGSAVFPTSGVANPTLTIVALALRLADHLAGGSR